MPNKIEIFENTLLKLVVRQGPNTDRENVVLDAGELGYTTDTKRLFVGDNETAGGLIVGSKVIYGTDNTLTTSSSYAFDLGYSTNTYTAGTTYLYMLSSGNANDINSWKPIAINIPMQTIDNWHSVHASVSSTSSNWDSVYTSVGNTSSDWDSVYTSVSNTSSNWDSTHTTVNSTSSDWDSVYTSVNNTSSNWNSTHTTVNSTSSDWVNAVDELNELQTELSELSGGAIQLLAHHTDTDTGVGNISLSASQIRTLSTDGWGNVEENEVPWVEIINSDTLSLNPGTYKISGELSYVNRTAVTHLIIFRGEEGPAYNVVQIKPSGTDGEQRTLHFNMLHTVLKEVNDEQDPTSTFFIQHSASNAAVAEAAARWSLSANTFEYDGKSYNQTCRIIVERINPIVVNE